VVLAASQNEKSLFTNIQHTKSSISPHHKQAVFALQAHLALEDRNPWINE